MATIGYTLLQAFMPKNKQNGGGGGGGFRHHHRPIILSLVVILALAIVIAVSLSLSIVFPRDSSRHPLCRDRRILGLPLPVDLSVDADSDGFRGAFYLTNEEVADYYWRVVFWPSAIVFLVSGVYLVVGMLVVYSASTQHQCL